MSLLNDDKEPQKLLDGILNTSSAAARRIAKKYKNSLELVTPLEFMLNVLNDSDIDMRHRLNAAKSALPYMHQQMPSMVEISGRDGGAIEHTLLANDAHRALESVLIDGEVEIAEIEHIDSNTIDSISPSKADAELERLNKIDRG